MRLKVVIVDGDNVGLGAAGVIPSLNVAVPGPAPTSTPLVAVLRIAYHDIIQSCAAGVCQTRSAPGTVLMTRSFFLHCLLGLDLSTNSPAAAETVHVALDDARCGKVFCHVDLLVEGESGGAASRVEVAPVDPDDYELLCMYSDQVCDIALAQMHVLSVGQRFPLVLDTAARVSVLLQVVSVGGSGRSRDWKEGDMPDYVWLGNTSEIVVLSSLDETAGVIQHGDTGDRTEKKVTEKTMHAMDDVEAVVVTLTKGPPCGHHGTLKVPCRCEGSSARTASWSLWRVQCNLTPLQFVIKLNCCDAERCVKEYCADDLSGTTRTIRPILQVDETFMANIGSAFPDNTSFSLVRVHERDVYVDAKLSVVSMYILRNTPDAVERVNRVISDRGLTIVDLFGRWLQWQCYNSDGAITTLSNCVVDLSDSDLFEERFEFQVFVVFNGDIRTTAYSTCLQLKPQSIHSRTQFHVENMSTSGNSIVLDNMAIYNSPLFVCANPSFFEKEASDDHSAMNEYSGMSIPVLQQMTDLLSKKVKHSIPGGIVLTGGCGIGKTYVIRCLHHYVLKNLHCFSLKMDCRSLIHGSNSSTAINIGDETKITNKFRMIMFMTALCVRNATEASGAVLFLDNFDIIFEETSAAQNGTSLKYSSMFNDAFVWLQKYHPKVITVVSCQNIDYKLPFFRSLGVFSHYFEITTSSYQTLFLLLSVCHSSGCKLVDDDGISINLHTLRNQKLEGNMLKLERLMKPLIPRDVVNLVALARNKDDRVIISSVIQCLETQQLARYGSVHTDHDNHSDESSHVGGYQKVLNELKRLIEVPLMYNTLFADDESQRQARNTLKLNKGILLYGPPGCGKTFIARNIARALHLNLVTVKGPQLLSKFIGQSEAAVRDIFARAADAQPSMLFFDEFDALAPRRGHDSTGVTDRVVNQLLTLLDGVDGGTSDENKVIIIVAATNRPDLVDLALLRPGRIETKLYVGYPESKEDVRGVLDAVLSTYPAYKELLGDHTCDLMVEHAWSQHLSPADIRHAVHSAVTSIVKSVAESQHPEQELPNVCSIQGECFSRKKQPGKVSREMVDVTPSMIPGGIAPQPFVGTSPQIRNTGMDKITAEVAEKVFSDAMFHTTASLPVSERVKYQGIFRSFSGRTDIEVPFEGTGEPSSVITDEAETRISVPPQRQTLA